LRCMHVYDGSVANVWKTMEGDEALTTIRGTTSRDGGVRMAGATR